jgi:hypothetical protein
LNETQQQFIKDTQDDNAQLWDLAGRLRQRARLYQARMAEELGALDPNVFAGKPGPDKIGAFYQLIAKIDELLSTDNNEAAIIELL